MVFNKKFSGLMGAKNDALVLPQLPCIKKTSDKDTFVQIEIPTCGGTDCDGEQRRRITGLSPRVWGDPFHKMTHSQCQRARGAVGERAVVFLSYRHALSDQRLRSDNLDDLIGLHATDHGMVLSSC